MHTCMMCTSLYVKANGDIPCWDDVGESHILRRFTISASDLATEPLFHSPEPVHIRESLRVGTIPFNGWRNVTVVTITRLTAGHCV